MTDAIGKIFQNHHSRSGQLKQEQEQRKRGIIRPSILVKNNTSIPLKSELEL
jgi:hypothetical protein